MSTHLMRSDEKISSRTICFKFQPGLLVGLSGGLLVLAVLLAGRTLSHAEEPNRGESQGNSQPQEAFVLDSASQARTLARVLHDTVHASLQVVHRDFFNSESTRSIPSRTLEDVFRGLEKKYGIELRWLAVDAIAMSVDNNPQNDFEHAAVKAITAGQDLHEETTTEEYRYAGRVRLVSQCLKCHLPNRMSNKERSAALLIRIPLTQPAQP